MVKMVWERDELAFTRVSKVFLIASPASITPMICMDTPVSAPRSLVRSVYLGSIVDHVPGQVLDLHVTITVLEHRKVFFLVDFRGLRPYP